MHNGFIQLQLLLKLRRESRCFRFNKLSAAWTTGVCTFQQIKSADACRINCESQGEEGKWSGSEIEIWNHQVQTEMTRTLDGSCWATCRQLDCQWQWGSIFLSFIYFRRNSFKNDLFWYWQWSSVRVSVLRVWSLVWPTARSHQKSNLKIFTVHLVLVPKPQ